MDQFNRKRPHGGMTKNQAKKQKFNENILSEAPQAIDVIEYAKCRAAELQLLDEATKKRKVSQAVNGLMSISMRRRAMSHNVKRMPRRVREMVTIKANKHKKPSRKHRRRPKNLLQEYIRRQKSKVWLETHIWHAKRFKMADKWGYKIPYQPTNKSARASYRATQHHCQMIDVSYLCCIEILGKEENILNGASSLCNSQTGPTIGAKMYLEGTREGNCVLYKQNQYPQGPICPVTFLWRPKSELEPLRQLWIWCHPSSFEELWKELETCLSLSEKCDVQDISVELSCSIEGIRKGQTLADIANSSVLNNNSKEDKTSTVTEEGDKQRDKSNESKETNDKTKKHKSKKHTSTGKASEEKFVKVINRKSQIGKVFMASLKDRLVRHRFIGPESQKILARTLHVADIMFNCKDSTYWWKEYYEDKKHSLDFNQQREFWDGVAQCQSAAELSPHAVIGLTVRDPRVIRAKKRNENSDTVSEIPESMVVEDIEAIKLMVSQDVSNSPIWDEEIRKTVTSTKKSDFEINQLKSKHLVPGSELMLGEEESRIPVLLIQNPGTNPSAHSHSHYGNGWDLILPAGWSMAFWVASIYHGARAGGLRELQCLANEQQIEHFPDDYPDTLAGREEEARVKSKKEAEHSRRPPAKRPNFTKLDMANPFSLAWNELVNCDKQDTTGFHVLRDRKDLNALRKLVNIPPGQKKKLTKSSNSEEFIASYQDILSRHQKSLVFVEISMNSKGCPEEVGTISIPTKEDVRKMKADKYFVGPLRSQQPDPELEDKKEKKKRAKLLKKGVLNLPPQKTPENSEVVKDNEDDGEREIIGFVKHGGFSLNNGHGAGKGFCSLAGVGKLFESLPDERNLVLIRNPRTLQYRFARLSL